MPHVVIRPVLVAFVMVVALLGFAPAASAATGTIGGTVTALGTGAPVDAWVFIYSAQPETDVFTDPCADDFCVGADQTDASGNFSVSGLAVGTYRVFVQSNSAGTYSRWYGGKGDAYAQATAVAAPNGGTTTLAIALTVKGGISGTVSDDLGTLTGATVTAYQVSQDGSQSPTGKNTTTDATGHYRIAGLASGNYRLVATQPSHVSRWNGGAATFALASNVAVADDADTTGISFVLARYGSIAGTVVNGAAAAVSGASVEAHRVVDGADGGVAQTTTTAAGGTFTLVNLAPGPYRVRVLPSGVTYGQAWNGSAASFAAAADITVASGAAVTGTAITVPDSPGGISGTVTPVIPGTTVTAMPWGLPVGAPDTSVTTTIDASGNYAIAVPPGYYVLRITPPASRPDYTTEYTYQYCDFGCWWNTSSSTSDIGWGGASSIQVAAGVVTSGVGAVLHQRTVLAGRITDTQGHAVANASVQLWLRQRYDPWAVGQSTAWDVHGSDACGDYSGFQGDPAPCLSVTTDADGRYVVHPPVWPQDAFWADGEDFLLYVVPHDGLHAPRWVGATADSTQPPGWPLTIYDLGTEWVTVPGYGNAPEELHLDQVLGGAGLFSGTLTSSAGGPAAGVAVRVHANLDDGSPLAGRDYTTSTAADGTWTVGALPPGGYSIHFGEGSTSYLPTAYLAGAGQAVAAYQARTGINATLQAGGRITGTITGDSGAGAAPVAGATVHAYLPAGGEVASAVTGPTGSYELTLAVGTYRLLVTAASGDPFASRWLGTGATSQATATDLAVTLGGTTTADAALEFTGSPPEDPLTTALSIGSSPATVVAGSGAVVTGSLTVTGGDAVAGALVALEARVGASGTFQAAGTTTTSPSGGLSLPVSPSATTTYRWVYAGDSTHAAATSATTTVSVAYALTAGASRSSIVAGAKVAVTGRLAGAAGAGVPGTVLTLQARSGSAAFVAVAQATTSASGNVALTLAPTASTTYRWVYAGDATHLAGTSATTVVSVSQAVTATSTKRVWSRTQVANLWGRVTPQRAGTVVVLEQLVKGRWVTTSTKATVKLQRLPGARTASLGYVFLLKRAKGAYTFRVAAPATKTNLRGTSTAVTLRFT